MKCKACGQLNPRDAEFCYVCGSKLEKGKMGTIAWIIGGVAAGLVVVAIAIFLLFGFVPNQDNEDSSPSGEAEATETAVTEQPNEGKPGQVQSTFPVFTMAAASSVLPPEYDSTYVPEHVFDGDIKTAWVEGVSHAGEGEWIQLSAAGIQTVQGIEIVNGYCKSEEIYIKNNRVRDIRITFDDGTSETFSLKDDFGRYQNFDFSEPKNTTAVKMEILSVYKGVKYQDTCISEVILY